MTTRNESTCYCIGIRRAANAVTVFYDSALEPTGLTVNQFSLIRNLQRLGTSSISKLADYVGLERTTLTRTLKPLMQQGLIIDSADAGKRDRKLQLTGYGEEILKQGIPLWEEAQAEIEERLGKEGLQWVSKIADKL